jgi:hypothetical protein
MSAEEKVKSPASYFPSIEKKYGKPIQHWLDLIQQSKGLKHMEIGNKLKTDHEMGLGHANAIVAYALSDGKK